MIQKLFTNFNSVPEASAATRTEANDYFVATDPKLNNYDDFLSSLKQLKKKFEDMLIENEMDVS